MKLTKNVVFVHFTDDEIDNMPIFDIREYKEPWYKNGRYNRFPYLLFVDTLEEAFKHQGFMVIIKSKDLGTMSLVDFDKKYRKKLKKYRYISIVDPKSKNFFDDAKYDLFSRIGRISEEKLYDNCGIPAEDLDNLYTKTVMKNKKLNVTKYIIEREDYSLDYYYKQEAKKKDPKMQSKRKEKVFEIAKWVRKQNTFTTTEVMSRFKINKRMVQRYMHDILNLGYEVGYDKKNHHWYYIKRTTQSRNDYI